MFVIFNFKSSSIQNAKVAQNALLCVLAKMDISPLVLFFLLSIVYHYNSIQPLWFYNSI